MSDFNFESFNFENLVGDNPFGEQKTGYSDDRFYKLTKDKDDNGTAIIRFLPDPDKKLIQQLYKINANTTKNGQKRWFSEWSPQSIGRKDPFQEHWAKLWNAGDKQESKNFARQERYIVNILVVKDPANSANDGKIFLLEMSKTLKERVQGYLMPSKEDLIISKKPAELFNPMDGQNFVLRSKRGANGFINYDSSEPMPDKTAVFASKEEAVEAIKTRCYRLQEFLEESMYPTNEFLQEKLDYVLFKDVTSSPVDKAEVVDVSTTAAPASSTQVAATSVPAVAVPAVATPTAPQTNLDDFLDQIM